MASGECRKVADWLPFVAKHCHKFHASDTCAFASGGVRLQAQLAKPVAAPDVGKR